MEEQVRHSLSQMFRIGTVTSTDPSSHTVRVVFPEDGNVVSYDLPVLVRNSYDNCDYNMPDVNEDVVCLFRSDGLEDGVVIGSFYTGEVKPPANSQDIREVKFKDGTTVTYDRASHELDVVIADTHIHADRQKVDVTTKVSVNVTTDGTINLDAKGNINISSSANVNITGSKVNIN